LPIAARRAADTEHLGEHLLVETLARCEAFFDDAGRDPVGDLRGKRAVQLSGDHDWTGAHKALQEGRPQAACAVLKSYYH
jgi:hypothetical protein